MRRAPLTNESMHQEENQAQPSMNKGNESTSSQIKRKLDHGCFFCVHRSWKRVAIFSGRIIFLRNNKFLHFIEAIENGDAPKLE